MDLTFHQEVHLKKILIFVGGIFTGLFLAIVLMAWLSKKSLKDKDLPEVKIMRIKKGKKSFYVLNPKSVWDAVHTLFIILGWELRIIRKNSIYYANAKISKIISIIAVLFFMITILLSFILIGEIIYTGDH